MTDHPILFNAAMVRATLDGRKTQTRRLLKIRGHRKISDFGPSEIKGYDWTFRDESQFYCDYTHQELYACLPYKVGDRLWVREAHYLTNKHAFRLSVGVEQRVSPENDYDACVCKEGFDRSTGGLRLRPSIHMPRWASRLTLVVTDVRVHRLQDISAEDAEAEGLLCGETECGELVYSGLHQSYPIPPEHCHHWAEEAFAALWNATYGPDAWAANPWVTAITFEPHRVNIDQMGEVICALPLTTVKSDV